MYVKEEQLAEGLWFEGPELETVHILSGVAFEPPQTGYGQGAEHDYLVVFRPTGEVVAAALDGQVANPGSWRDFWGWAEEIVAQFLSDDSKKALLDA